MTSKIKVDNINKVSDDSNIISKCGSAVSVGASGNTVTVTGNDIRSDSYKAADGGVIASQSGTTITLGASGDTITLASGASQSGFGRSGSVNWQTTPKTATFTPVNGEGYFINSGSAITANLPAGSAGAIVAFSDYARNFATYNLTVTPNGSEKIGGNSASATLDVSGQAATFIYVDSTKGWVNVQNAENTEIGKTGFVMASGGTETISGDCKIHTFTSPGTFSVAALANAPANNVIGYLVVAGGGGSGGGGGGAGGFREGRTCSITPYSVSPLAVATGLTATASSFPITVGAGGPNSGVKGSDSIFSSITSTGGGGGKGSSPTTSSGGSGGGGRGSFSGCSGPAGAGNTPPVSPSQGNPGGAGTGPDSSNPLPNRRAGGGGGATASGQAHCGSPSGAGGAGATTSISATPTAYAGGGGGNQGPGSPSPGGTGGGGAGGSNGTANTGGGGGGNGGSGVVIIRYKFQ